MKLSEIQKILRDNIVNLKLPAAVYTQPAQPGQPSIQYLDFSGLDKYRYALDEINKAGILQEEIKAIKESAIYKSYNETLRVFYSDGNLIVNSNNQLVMIAKALLGILDSTSKPPEANSIIIKFPHIHDFADLCTVSEQLQMILSQSIINPHIKGRIEIRSVENGSIWFEVFVETSEALTLIAGLTWSAMVIYKKMQEGKMFYEYGEGIKIKNEGLQVMQEAQKKFIDMLLDAESNNLYNANFSNNDPEQIGRLRLSIKMLSELIEKGAEVHPALNTPETVANLFPDKKNLATLESKTKQIENKNPNLK